MHLFENKIVVITGATSGIGRATAKLFAQNGANVILLGRNECKGHALAKEIDTFGGKSEFLKCDVSDEININNAADKIADTYDHVDVLFNNAGIMLPSAEIENIFTEDWERTFDVNVKSIFYITRSLKKLIFKCRGCVINNASIAGMHSYVAGKSYAYSASKAAVIQFSRQMAKNYAKYGVRVNCVCPGIIDTPILGNRDRKLYSERIPMGYVGIPEDVAKVIAFLASDGASYITGAVLPVDGGGTYLVHKYNNKLKNPFNKTLFKTFSDFINLPCWEQVKNSKILVTGGTGFVGFYVIFAKRLLFPHKKLII